MRKSIVYFLVTVTVLSLGLALVPRGFSQTQDLKVVSYSYYIDGFGNLDVVGEVQNTGPNTLTQLALSGSVYSPGNVDQADSYTQVWASYLNPQQEAPFYMEFSQPNSSPDGTWYSVDISSIALTVTSANATSSYEYPDLKITSSTPSIGSSGDYNGAYEVNGVIQNTGSQTAQNLTVVGEFFNSTGSVIAVGYTNYLTPASLSPSGTLSFQIYALDLNQSQVSTSQKITSYTLLVQTGLPIIQGTAPIITPSPASSQSPSPTSSASSTGSPSTTPTDAVNSKGSSNSAEIYAIVIVVAIIAVVGAILMLTRRKPHATVKAQIKSRKQK